MKPKYLPIVLCFLVSGIYAQVPLIQFDNYTPEWVHMTVDSTDITATNPYGTNQIYIKESLIDGNDLYIVYNFGVFFPRYQGAYIEKLNLFTGKRVWVNYYNFSNNDNKMELVSDIYINDEHQLEILGYRPIEQGSYINRFSRRTYNTDNGSLIEHQFTEPVDNSSCNIAVDSYSFKTNIFPYGENYQFLSTAQLNAMNIENKEELFNFIFDKNTHNVSKDYLQIENELEVVSFLGFKLINQDTILSIQINFETNPTYINYFIELYDRDMNSLLRKELPELERDHIRYIKYADSEYFIMEQGLDSIHGDIIYLYDIEGNLIHEYHLLLEDSLRAFSTKITRLDNGSFLVVAHTEWLKKGNYDDLVFLQLHLDGRIETKKRIKMLPVDYSYSPHFIYEVDSGDIVIGGVHGYKKFYSSENPKPGLYGQWPEWIRFSADDLDLATGIGQHEKLNLDQYVLSPNPSIDNITLKFEEHMDNVNIKIYNTIGELVHMQETNNKTIDIPIDHLISGVYTITIDNKYGRHVMQNKRFIKI